MPFSPLGSAHALDERGFPISRHRARSTGAVNYVKVVCRALHVHDLFFFSSDPKSRSRALDAAIARRDSLAGRELVRLSVWLPCPGMPDHVRAICAVYDEE